ncbi:MAG: hypothetical protein H0U23_15785 [Blastocatellia bacterium]|nr:hypothetical protein [Blastocatellia bacterium]
MTKVTLEIPPKWQKATGPIIRFCEEQIRITNLTALPCEFTVTAGAPWSDAIWMKNSTLSGEAHFIINAEMGVLSEAIKNGTDPWQATGQTTFLQLQEEIRALLGDQGQA